MLKKAYFSTTVLSDDPDREKLIRPIDIRIFCLSAIPVFTIAAVWIIVAWLLGIPE